MGKNCILKMRLNFLEGALFPALIFLFTPEAAFNIANVAEFPCLNGDGHLHQKGEDEEPGCPDAEGHHEF